MDSLCPCQSQLAFAGCCQPFLTNKKHATSAEALMRSRFVAYHQNNWKYVFKTWHKSTRPSMSELRSGGLAGGVEWLNLKVVRCEEGL
ncbi:MAG: YchJ family metal-binding protein, partial [Thiotrichaceae bacterium]